MIKARTPVEPDAPIAVLFPPGAVPLIDIFRALGDFEEHYDIAALDEMEANLSCLMSRDAAKSIVSDALLLAFSLRRERCEALHFAPLQSRRGTLDEYRLLALIGASYWHDDDLACDAAAALKIVHHRAVLSLASDIARRLDAAGLAVEEPDGRLLHAAPPASPLEVEVEKILSGERKLSFDV
jgi:hypothetical protein